MNGALTVGENIGDLGGLGIAYQAWQLALNGEALRTWTEYRPPSVCSCRGR